MEEMNKHERVNPDLKMNLFGSFRDCLETERVYILTFLF